MRDYPTRSLMYDPYREVDRIYRRFVSLPSIDPHAPQEEQERQQQEAPRVKMPHVFQYEEALVAYVYE